MFSLLDSTIGIREAIQTRSPVKLLDGIGMDTNHWPLQGYARLQGSIDVCVIFIDVGAYVFLELDGQAKFADINGDGYVTFSQVYWMIRKHGLLAAVEVDLVLKAGFGLWVKACINLLFWKKCWNVAKVEWSEPVFQKHWGGYTNAMVASPDGTINLNVISIDNLYLEDSIPIIRLYNSLNGLVIDYYPAGFDPNSVRNQLFFFFFCFNFILATTSVENHPSCFYFTHGKRQSRICDRTSKY